MIFVNMLALALSIWTQGPVSRFVYQCNPTPSLSCTFASIGVGKRYDWDWGDGRKESHLASTATNTWQKSGTYSVSLTVTDSIGGSSTSSQQVLVPTCACGVVDTIIPPPVIIPPLQPPNGVIVAELPRVSLDTRMPVTMGNTITVPVGGDLQAALNLAQPCDVIELANAGVYIGNFILPNKPGGNCWIIIRPQNGTVIPPEGTRINPRTMGKLPVIQSPNNLGAITTANGSHHWRLVGLEVTIGSVGNTGLIRLGTGYETTLAQLPHDIVLDRMYVHGNSIGNLRRSVILNGINEAVIDSDLRENHETGTQSQGLGGWNGPGPFKITNDYIEGASENIIFGGSDPSIQGVIPSDIEIRHNHIFKPLSYQGKGWAVANLLELKNAQRVLVEGNVMEQNWADAQGGSAINLKSVNQGGNCPWCVTKDVTFRLNLIHSVGSGYNLSGRDSSNPLPPPMERVTIYDNIIDGINVLPFTGDGRGVSVNNNPIDVTLSHNTILDPTNMAIGFGGPLTDLPVRFTFINNLIGSGQYGVKGPGIGTVQTFAQFVTGQFMGNVIVGGVGFGYPTGNFFPVSKSAVGYGSYPALSITSPFSGKATDGRDPGANVPAVLTATNGVVQP